MPFPVDSKWITETETKLGVRFPASFVVAMAKMNGGAVDVGTDVFWLHPFMDKSDKKRIQRTCNSICRETASLRELEYFQNELVVIGHNGGGDALVLKPWTTIQRHWNMLYTGGITKRRNFIMLPTILTNSTRRDITMR